MRSKNFVFGVVGLVLIFSIQSFAQSSNLSLGVDYGSGIVQAGDFGVYFVPKHIRGNLEIAVGTHTLLRGSVGYGMTKHETKSDVSYQGNRFTEEFKIDVKGLPIEGAFIFHVPIDNQNRFEVRFGLAGGYYSYTIKQEGFREEVFNNQVFRDELDEPDIKISGIAQSFLAGLSIGISPKIRAILEVSKMGFSMIKVKQDIEIEDNGTKINVGESEENFNAATGLNDLGVTVGIYFNLGS